MQQLLYSLPQNISKYNKYMFLTTLPKKKCFRKYNYNRLLLFAVERKFFLSDFVEEKRKKNTNEKNLKVLLNKYENVKK